MSQLRWKPALAVISMCVLLAGFIANVTATSASAHHSRGGAEFGKELVLAAKVHRLESKVDSLQGRVAVLKGILAGVRARNQARVDSLHDTMKARAAAFLAKIAAARRASILAPVDVKSHDWGDKFDGRFGDWKHWDHDDWWAKGDDDWDGDWDDDDWDDDDWDHHDDWSDGDSGTD